MRRCKPMSIGELWEGTLDGLPFIKRKFAEARVPEVWADVVGPSVAAKTLSIAVRNGVLYVSLSSSVVRHEMFMRRAQLRDAINDRVGMALINNIIVK